MASQKPNILVVLSSHSPGWYLPELAHPLHILAPHCDIVIASHLGGEAPLDSSSIESFKDDEVCSKFVKEQETLWKNTAKLETFVGKADQFDAIFYVGGYGLMFDLVDSKACEEVITDFHGKNKLISGICHGPATFSRLTLPGTNTKLLHGHKVTGVSNMECEILFPMSGIVEPFSVEDELNNATNGQYERAEPFNSRVVVSKGPDGRTLITAQNPDSGMDLGKAIYAELFGNPYNG